MILLLLKLTLAPALVAGATLATRRWGLKIGGAIAGFPVAFGPIIFFIALEQGTDFAAASSLRGLVAIFPFTFFVLTMAWACLRFSLWISLMLGWTAYMGVNWALMGVDMPLWLAIALAVAGIVAGLQLLPHGDETAGGGANSVWDIPVRMISTLVLLLGVTAAAKPMGTDWSGAMAAFPIASSVLGIFSRMSNGPYGPARLYKGVLLGCCAFGAFCLVLHLALPAYGLTMGFLAAILGAVCVQIGALFLASRRN